jgi:hypothetical protein
LGEIALTQEDMAAEIKSLRGEVLQLQKQQEDQRRLFLLWSRISGCVVIVLAITAAYFNAVFPLAPMKLSSGILFTIWPLGVLVSFLGYAGRPTKKL